MAAVVAYGGNGGGSGGRGGRGETATMALRQQGRRCWQDIAAAFMVMAVVMTAVVAADGTAAAVVAPPLLAFAGTPLHPCLPLGFCCNSQCCNNEGVGPDAA